MRIASPLAALIAVTTCGCAKPREAPPEPAASASAPIQVTVPATATATADSIASAAAPAPEPEPVVEPEDAGAQAAVCPPMPAQRPADFSVLYEVYTAPIRGSIHAFGQIVGNRGTCHDDGKGPAFYHDDLALRCVHADDATLDHLYAEIRTRGFWGMRQSSDMGHGPRHVARRAVVRYQGKRCERIDSFGKPLEWKYNDGFLRVMDAIGAVLNPKPTSTPL